jgi:hypothetical protein
MADSINVLTDLDTLGVSLVRRGANKRRVALTKSEEGMKDAEEILKAVLEMETDDEDKIEEVFKALSPKGVNAVKGAMRLLNAFKEELPKDVMSGLSKLAGFAAPAKAEGEGYDFPPKKKQENAEEEDEAKMKKTLENVPEELRDTLQELWKSHDEGLQEQIKKSEERADKAETQVTELAKTVTILRDDALRKEMIEKAENSYGALGSPEEIGGLLKDLHGAGGELAEKIEKLLGQANERVAKSALLDELGRSGGGETAHNAWDKIEKAAKSIVEKSEEPLSQAEAVDMVIRKQPELYNEYLAEKEGAH